MTTNGIDTSATLVRGGTGTTGRRVADLAAATGVWEG
jgi:hypothetical protein